MFIILKVYMCTKFGYHRPSQSENKQGGHDAPPIIYGALNIPVCQVGEVWEMSGNSICLKKVRKVREMSGNL